MKMWRARPPEKSRLRLTARKPKAGRALDEVARHLPGRQIHQTWEEWDAAVAKMVDLLPWFGQEILVPRGLLTRLPRERLSLYGESLVLLSLLAVGTMSQMARRTGVARRTAYTLILRIIHTHHPWPMLETC